MNRQNLRAFFHHNGCMFFALWSLSIGSVAAADDVAAYSDRVGAEIQAAAAKGVGVKPYEEALKAVRAEIAAGGEAEALRKRLDSLSQNLRSQMARMHAIRSQPNRVVRRSSSFSSGDSDSEEGASDFAPPADGRFDIDKFVYTVRGASEIGDVSPQFIEEVKREINKLPYKLLAALQARGGRVCITPRLADKLPDFRNTRPRGWEYGTTGKNVDGLFDGTDVLVCEWSTSYEDDSSLVKNSRVGYIVRHESGHAFDHYWGRISASPDYKHTYYLELAKMDPDQKDAELAYFAQKAEGGPSECFAELFAIMVGGGASKNVDANLAPIFPQCSKMIRTRLSF